MVSALFKGVASRSSMAPKAPAWLAPSRSIRPTSWCPTARRAYSHQPSRPIDTASLKVNRTRLMEDLHYTCQWGTGKRWGAAVTATGMSRLALSDADKQARDWFIKTTEELGCEITVDTMGNIFAIRPGLNPGPPTVAGSHLDTQPTGGRYDGILGVHAGVEMLKVLKERNIRSNFPVGVVNWTNEEGARFPISMVSSGVWSGNIPLKRALELPEVGGGTATMQSELERIGYLGPTPASHEAMPLAAHFELHIEQGTILERAKRKIGVVKGVQAYKWFTIDVVGRDAHTGTTPFESRADAMLAAAEMIVSSREAASKLSALASTGVLTLSPGSVNTIPGHVRFSLDIRSPEDSIVETLEKALRAKFAAIASNINNGGLPLSVTWTTDTVSPAVHFHEKCIACVQSSAESVLGSKDLISEIVSGAGHDSVYTSRRCPTSMIFVPSKNGISHHPEEFTSAEDCAIGAEVLLQSVMQYDQQRSA